MRPGLSEILIVLLIVVVLFGASRFAQLGRSLGEGIRGFKDALKDDKNDKPKE